MQWYRKREWKYQEFHHQRRGALEKGVGGEKRGRGKRSIWRFEEEGSENSWEKKRTRTQTIPQQKGEEDFPP